MISDRLPEVYRYVRLELRPRRLVIAAVTISIISLCLLFGSWAEVGQSSENSVRWLVGLEFLMLVTYGATCTGESVLSERQSRTWDFQLLTPQTSGQLVIGKFIGASLFPLCLAGLFFVWALIGWMRLPYETKYYGFWYLQLHFAAVSALVLAIGMLVTTYSPVSRNATLGRLTAVMGLILYAMNIWVFTEDKGPDHAAPSGRFFFLPALPGLIITANALFYAFWALAAAKWKIGYELLERPRLWRVPAFVTCLTWLTYESVPSQSFDLTALSSIEISQMHEARRLASAMISGVAMTYVMALFGHDTVQDWNPARERLRPQHLPAWFWAWVALCLNGLVLFSIQGPDLSGGVSSRRTEVLFSTALALLFCLRDILFIQFVRLGRFKNPELASAIFLVTFYFATNVLVLTADLDHLRAAAWPLAHEMASVPETFLPILAQVFLVAGALLWRISKRLRPLQQPLEPAA